MLLSSFTSHALTRADGAPVEDHLLPQPLHRTNVVCLVLPRCHRHRRRNVLLPNGPRRHDQRHTVIVQHDRCILPSILAESREHVQLPCAEQRQRLQLSMPVPSEHQHGLYVERKRGDCQFPGVERYVCVLRSPGLTSDLLTIGVEGSNKRLLGPSPSLQQPPHAAQRSTQRAPHEKEEEQGTEDEP